MVQTAAESLSACLRPGRHAHLIGIGGVSMQPLALALRRRGLTVTGSELRGDGTLETLRANGIPVFAGHRAQNLLGADFVVRTAAVGDDNPEVAAARTGGVPVFERAQLWGAIMRQYRQAICVAGTHGKTTTTAMLAQILIAGGRDPSVMLGGDLPLLGGGWRFGGGDTVLLESCEYRDSFLRFAPTVALITNVGFDHPDYFRDLAAVQASFRAFAALLPPDGRLLANGDDENTVQALSGLPCTFFGLGAQNEIRGENFRPGWQEFDVFCRDRRYCSLKLSVFGRHNAQNAVAACAAARTLGVPGTVCAEALAAFSGVRRRLEYRGSLRGARCYDDYSHHPEELAAMLAALRELRPSRVILAFQPHTYSRTQALLGEFAAVLRQADLVLLAEIYPARERNLTGICSRDLAALIPGSACFDSLSALADRLSALARPGDVIVTAGAGDIDRIWEKTMTDHSGN